MRPSLPAVALALIAGAAAAPAQERVPVPERAFPAAITTSIGIASFSDRYVQDVSGVEYAFGGSLALSVRGDMPLTRRVGFLTELMVAPLAKQRAEHPLFGRSVQDGVVVVVAAHAGLGGRLKPAAPVFFEVGGGVTMATKHALPDADGRSIEPHAGFTIGYDARPFGRSNIRFTYTGRLGLIDEPDDPTIEAKSMAYDQVIQIGLRFVPSRVAIRRARP